MPDAAEEFDAIIIGLTGGGTVYPVSGPSVVECKGLGDGGNLHMFNQSNKCRFPFETQAVNLFWKGRAEFDLARDTTAWAAYGIKRNDEANSLGNLALANGSTGAGHELLLWALINVGICILVALLRRRPARRTLA